MVTIIQIKNKERSLTRRFWSSICPILHSRPSKSIPVALWHVNKEPNDHGCTEAYGKKERESHPIIMCLVNDGLNYGWTNDRCCTIGEAEKSKELYIVVWEVYERKMAIMLTHHIIEPWWSEFSHHCLSISVVWCLEETKNDIVRPSQIQWQAFKSNKQTYQNSQTLWKLKEYFTIVIQKVLLRRTQTYLSRYQACPKRVSRLWLHLLPWTNQKFQKVQFNLVGEKQYLNTPPFSLC